MGWEFPALLVGALLLSLYLGVMQQRRYARAVNDLARAHQGEGRFLVTGRGQGRVRGTIVMLVVDDASDQVIAAEVLRGTTVFARSKPAPELLGPVTGLLERADSKPTRTALEQALEQLARRRTTGRKVVPSAKPTPLLTAQEGAQP